MNRLLFLSSLLATLAAASCSSSSGGGGACTKYEVPATTVLTTPAVSFRTGVLPIFERSCGLSESCHGSTASGRVFLGTTSGAVKTDPSAIVASLVGQPSQDLPSMSLVKAGDPTQSFLMHKMDGDQCLFDAQCTGMTCATSMPQNLPVLDVSSRDVVRRWIAQGAKDD